MVDTNFRTNSHSWSQGYNAARSQVEQDKQKTGSIRQQIDDIHKQVGSGQVSASQASQLASLTSDLDTASAKFRDDSQKLTGIAKNTDSNSDELHDANTEIAGGNTDLKTSIDDLHDLQAHNNLDGAGTGSSNSWSPASRTLESQVDDITKNANLAAVGGNFTMGNHEYTTNLLTNNWHTDASHGPNNVSTTTT